MNLGRTSLLENPCPSNMYLFSVTNVRDRHSHDNADHVNFQPERNEHGEDVYGLLVATIDGALIDAQRTPPTVRKLGATQSFNRFQKMARARWETNRDMARTWLLDEQDQEGRRAFSFEWCCLALGWDSIKTRKRLHELLEEVPSSSARTVEAA
jgi:hypothetical protein